MTIQDLKNSRLLMTDRHLVILLSEKFCWIFKDR